MPQATVGSENSSPLLRVVRDPVFRVGLVQQRRVVETNAQANGEAPVALRNQTLQFVIYLLRSGSCRTDHVED